MGLLRAALTLHRLEGHASKVRKRHIHVSLALWLKLESHVRRLSQISGIYVIPKLLYIFTRIRISCRLLSELQSLQHRYTDENGLAILLTSPGNNIATYLRNTRLLVVGFAMNMDASELSTQYKDLLRSLNPVLPLVIEHLAATSTLTRTETRIVLSKSDQFNRLCELLASKGLEKRPVIFSTIESFRRNLEQHKQTADRCFDETHVRQNHKHV